MKFDSIIIRLLFGVVITWGNTKVTVHCELRTSLVQVPGIVRYNYSTYVYISFLLIATRSCDFVLTMANTAHFLRMGLFLLITFILLVMFQAASSDQYISSDQKIADMGNSRKFSKRLRRFES